MTSDTWSHTLHTATRLQVQVGSACERAAPTAEAVSPPLTPRCLAGKDHPLKVKFNSQDTGLLKASHGARCNGLSFSAWPPTALTSRNFPD